MAITLYHYTRASNIEKIIQNGLLPSLLSRGDAQWGDGQYFTDLTPEEVATKTRFQVSYALFRMPWMWGGQPPLPEIGCLRCILTESNVKSVAPLFGKQFPHRSIFLYPNEKILDIKTLDYETDYPLHFASE